MNISTKSRYRPYLVAAAIYFVATLVFTWPLGMKAHNFVPDKKDTVVHIWKLAWEAHALSSNKANFWDGSIFYPAKRTNALADTQVGNLPFYWPVAAISGNPVLGHNVALLLSFFLSALSMFALTYYWTRNTNAALIAGFVFGFHPFRMTALPELHMLTWQWTPLTFLFLEKFLRHTRWRDALLAGIFFLWQLVSCMYYGYFLVIGVSIYIFIRIFSGGFQVKKVFIKGVVPALTVLILSTLYMKPFMQKYNTDSLERPLKEIVKGSLSLPDDLLSTYYANRLYGSINEVVGGFGIPIKQYFPGILVVLLTIVGIKAAWRSKVEKTKPNPLVLFGVLMITGFILALGPYLVFWETPTNIPMPHLLLLKILPGIDSIRVPARFMFLTIIGGCVLVAFGTEKLLSYFQKKPSLLTPTMCVITLLLSVEFFSAPIPLDPIPSLKEPHETYKWLRDAPIKGGVLELPFEGDYMEENFMYMYYNIYHFQPSVNGMSAFIPEEFQDLQRKFQVFPMMPIIDILRAKDINTLILHADRINWIPEMKAPESLSGYKREKTEWGWKYYSINSNGKWLIASNAQTLHYLKVALGGVDLGGWLARMGCSELSIYPFDAPLMDTILVCPIQDVAQENGLCTPDNNLFLSLLAEPVPDMFRNHPGEFLEANLQKGSAGLAIFNAPPYPYEIPKWNSELLQQRGVHLLKTIGSDRIYSIEGAPY